MVPMLGFWGLSLLSLRWPLVGAVMHAALAAGVLYLFGWRHLGSLWLWPPLLVLAVAYAWARPKLYRWLWWALAILPPLTALGYGVFPAYLDFTRIPLSTTGAARINNLLYAPAGPEWPQRLGNSWAKAQSACESLSEDGLTLTPQPIHKWRLVTSDELKATLPRHRIFTGQTTKDAPLWNKHTQNIYYWTAGNPTFVSYNGWVVKSDHKDKRGYIGWRCVKIE